MTIRDPLISEGWLLEILVSSTWKGGIGEPVFRIMEESREILCMNYDEEMFTIIPLLFWNRPSSPSWFTGSWTWWESYYIATTCNWLNTTLPQHAWLNTTLLQHAGLTTTLSLNAGLNTTLSQHAGLDTTLSQHAGLYTTLPQHDGFNTTSPQLG